MPVGLTSEQDQLAEAVGRFAARHAPLDKTRAAFDSLAAGEIPPWWGELVGQGFHAVHLPDSVGGQGGSLTDMACVVEAAAMALLPGPLLPTAIASAVAAMADVPQLLRELASGATAALAMSGGSDFRAVREAGGWRVTGTSAVTIGVCSARYIVLSARTNDGAPLWLTAENTGSTARAEPKRGTDLTVDVGVLELTDHPVPDAFVLNDIDTERVRSVAAGLVAAATSGVVRWCVAAVGAHLRTREQFGKLIGTFQALQHKAAMLLVNSELATAAAWDAVRATTESREQHRLAAATAALIAVAPAPDLVLEALTMFGAIGFTWEHDLHLYWRRATSLTASIGPVTGWARELGELARVQSRDMALNLGGAENDFRTRVAAVLDEAQTLRNDGPGRQGDYDHFETGPQRTLIAEAGLIAPHWPKPWGLAATPLQQLIIDEEFDRRTELVRPSIGIAEWIMPTLLSAGRADLHERFVAPTLRGDLAWCQLFSEPGAGSDLASLTTRATKVAGGWRVNGHKIWTSAAHRADFGAMLARTDPGAAKHRGIGYFIVEMAADGIEISPIRTADGEPHFNEVFLDDVFIPDNMLLGEPTDGWDLAIATMAQERVAISGYVKMDRAGALRQIASAEGPDHDAVVRALGELDAYTNAIKALGVRETIRLLDGQTPGPASSIAKVATNVMLRATAAATLKYTGELALVQDSDPAVVEPYLRLPAELIGGGTQEIQLNIIAQMILGLPRK